MEQDPENFFPGFRSWKNIIEDRSDKLLVSARAGAKRHFVLTFDSGDLYIAFSNQSKPSKETNWRSSSKESIELTCHGNDILFLVFQMMTDVI